MSADGNKRITIRNIEIRNYKGIDYLNMNFPPPRLANDPDIFVIGSRNGLGKTSILECCALLLIGPSILEARRLPLRDGHSVVNVPDLLIRADERSAEVKGDIVFGQEEGTFRIRIDRRGLIEVLGGTATEDLLETWNIGKNPGFDHLLTHICGFAPNPVVENTFLLFHSYRKVQEGNPEMGTMIEKGFPRQYYGVRPWDRIPLSEFKMQILRCNHSVWGWTAGGEDNKSALMGGAARSGAVLARGSAAGGMLGLPRWFDSAGALGRAVT